MSGGIKFMCDMCESIVSVEETRCQGCIEKYGKTGYIMQCSVCGHMFTSEKSDDKQ